MTKATNDILTGFDVDILEKLRFNTSYLLGGRPDIMSTMKLVT